MSHSDFDTLRRERDFYSRLVRLTASKAPDLFLDDALGAIVDMVGASQGLLQIVDADNEDQVHWLAHGFSSASQAEDVRALVSEGVIAEAIRSGRTVETSSAMLDARFSSRESVQSKKIDAVLCIPIGEVPQRGVLYLQGRERPGPFEPGDRRLAEDFCAHLSPLIKTLLLRQRAEHRDDPTAPVRSEVEASELVGRSAAVAKLLEDIALVARASVSVLLTGESGTGKTLVAKIIHENSGLTGDFVAVNCAAIPKELVETELFGFRPGGHSTATQGKDGLIAMAKGGTFLLDEIAEMSGSAQAKLLQLLQSGEYYPVGATRPEISTARVIAATNVDLEAAMDAGTFRRDLYYRLAALPIHVPSLAERPEDVGPLAHAILQRVCEKEGLPQLRLTHAAVVQLESTPWKGNVRELENVVGLGLLRALRDGGDSLEPAHLFPAVEQARPTTPDLESAIRQFKKDYLTRSLEETDWNVTKAAERMKISRAHTHKLIKELGLVRRDRKHRPTP